MAQDTVKRWVLTVWDHRYGCRALVGAQQGRYTFDTKERAQQAIDAGFAVKYYGPTVAPLLVDCWAGHHDPVGSIFAEASEEMLARVFARLLGDAVEEQGSTLAAVADANDLESNPAVCHSHDIVDANEVMAAAFVEVTGEPGRADSWRDAALWTAAWNRAKAARFWASLGGWVVGGAVAEAAFVAEFGF